MNWTKKLLMYEWDDLALALLLTAGFWLLGEWVGWIAPSVDKTITRILPIGLLVALIAGGMMLIFFSATRFGFEFGWLLQFGVPRRRQLAAQLAVQMVHGVAVAVFALLLGLVGRPFERLWFDGSLELVPLRELFPLWAPALLAVVPPLLGLFAGGFCKRFGRAGGYVLYFSFVLLCVSTGHLLNGTEDLVNVGFGLPLAVSAAVLLIVMAALGAHWLMTGDN